MNSTRRRGGFALLLSATALAGRAANADTAPQAAADVPPAAAAAAPAAVAAVQPRNAPDGRPLYRDAGQPLEARVEDLLSRMTLEEKVAQMISVWLQKDQIQTPSGDFSPEEASTKFPNGLGQIARPSDRRGVEAGNTAAGAQANVRNRTARETAEYINAAQRWAVENTSPRHPAPVSRGSPPRLCGPRRDQLPAVDRTGVELGPGARRAHLHRRRPRNARPRRPVRARPRRRRRPRSAMGPD